MTWYDDLENWIQTDRKRAWLEDVIVRAGLARVVSWTEAYRMLEALNALKLIDAGGCGGQCTKDHDLVQLVLP